jgi:cytochrome c-type biogenesis protein CcmH/NrfG
MKEKVEDLFAKITEAYNTVGDDHSRSEYVKTLKSSVSDKEMEEARRAMEAEVEFQKAEVFIKRGSWREAEERLERAIGLYGDEPEYKMYMGWVKYKIKGQSEAINAKRIIKEVLEKRPTAGDGWFFLGMIEKNEGNMDAAEQHLEKFIAKKPHDIDAKRELQIIARKRSAPAPKKKGGLFWKK